MKNKSFTIMTDAGNVYNFSQEDIDDLMATALEGGINYWCGKAEVVGEYLGEYGSEQISRGGELRLYDIEEDDAVYTLDLPKFLNGLKMYIEEMVPGAEGLTADEIMSGHDAISADSIVQYALFGQQVYA